MNLLNKKSWLKAISWRLVGSLCTFIVTFIVLGSFDLALGLTSIETFAKIALYYVHERAWESIDV